MSRNKIFSFSLICAIIFTLSVDVYPEEKDKKGALPNPEAEKPFQYDSKGRRDPFVPLVNREGLFFEPSVKKEAVIFDTGTDNVLSLEGIVYDEGGYSCAVIDSEIVKSGDKIGDYQVLEIQRQKVVLSKADEILELELKKEDE